MAWYYVEAGAQKGPVEDSAFLGLVANGTIRPETLVWREGMKDWASYAAATAPGAAGPAAVAGSAACGECGRFVPEEETVLIGGRRVCAVCKPAVVQRMIEGTSSGTGGFDPEELLADLRSRGGYTIDIGSVTSRSFDLVKDHLWPSVGVSLLMAIIAGAGGVIPFLGVFISWTLNGMVTGGTYRYFLLKVRRQGSTLNDAFTGFQAPYMKELMLAGMVVGAPAMLINLFGLGVQMLSLVQLQQSGGGLFESLMPVVVISFGALALLSIAFTVLWAPALIILADVPIGFWKALELSRRLVMQRILSWIAVYIVMFLLGIAGLLALCVGLLFVMPMLSVMFVTIWDDIRRQAAEVKQARMSRAV